MPSAIRGLTFLRGQLEKDKNTPRDLIEHIRESATRLLAETPCAVRSGIGKSVTKLSLDAKRHLFLFYKETVQNLSRYSQAKKVSIDILLRVKRLQLHLHPSLS